MILAIPLNELLASYIHVEPHLQLNQMTLKEFIIYSLDVMDKVEMADSRNYTSSPDYYLDFRSPYTEFENIIGTSNSAHGYEDMATHFNHHHLTALALEVYHELVNSLQVYKITELPQIRRSTLGWRGQNLLLRVHRNT